MLKKLSCCIVLFLCIGMLLAGCGPDMAANAPTATPSPAVSPTPTLTPRPTPTPTLIPVPTPTPVPTLMPTPKPTSAPSPTPEYDLSADYHPIMIYNGNPSNQGIIFGGSCEGEWMNYIDFIPRDVVDDFNKRNGWGRPDADAILEQYSSVLVHGGEEYMMCSIRGNAGSVIGSKPEMIIYDVFYPENSELTMTFDPALTMPESASIMVGVSGDWDPCPRLATPLDVGMGNHIDLDGDGVEEIIHFEPDSQFFGQFNFVLENHMGRSLFDSSYEGSEMLFADLNGDGIIEVIQTRDIMDVRVFEYKDGMLELTIKKHLSDEG